MLRTAAIPLSLGLAAGAQMLFLRGEAGWGSVFIVPAMVLFGVAAPSPNHFARFALRPEKAPPASPPVGRRFSVGITVSVGAWALSVAWFATVGEDLLVKISWGMAIAALFLSQHHRRPRSAFHRRDVAVLAMILLVAFALRTYRLTTLPHNLDGDFAAHGLEARALVTGKEPRLFALGWFDIPMFGFLPSALTMKFFGSGLVGLNAAGVVEGLLMIVGGFLLGRDLYGRRVGLLAASLLTISYVHIHFSRTSEYIDPAFFSTFALYLLLSALRHASGFAFVASGALTALAFLAYYSGRVALPIALALVAFVAATRWRWIAGNARGLVLWVLAVVVFLGPFLIVFTTDPAGFTSRTREVWLFDPDVMRHSKGVYRVDTVAAVIWEQAKRTLLMFHAYVDTSTQCGFAEPFLDPFTGVAFALGVAAAVASPAHVGNALLLSWLAATMLLGSFLTVNPPFWVRLVGLVVPATLLAASAIDRAHHTLHRAVDPAWRRAYRRIAVVAIIATLVIVGARNWRFYVESTGRYATPRTRIARFLAERRPDEIFYLVPDPFHSRDREFRFLAPGRLKRDIPGRHLARLERRGDPVTIVFTPNHFGHIDELKRRIPGIRRRLFPGNAPEEVAFATVTIPPAFPYDPRLSEPNASR